MAKWCKFFVVCFSLACNFCCIFDFGFVQSQSSYCLDHRYNVWEFSELTNDNHTRCIKKVCICEMAIKLKNPQNFKLYSSDFSDLKI